VAEVAGRLGSERVMVVHGHPGMDEVSASGPTKVAEFVDGAVRTYEIDPESVGIALGSFAAIAGGDAETNARIVREVLYGEHGAPRDVVLMNAAAALLVAGKVDDLAAGVAMARASIDSGEAMARFEALVSLTQRIAAEADARKGSDA
jgi:anthranilate phosphoribosyltransferase